MKTRSLCPECHIEIPAIIHRDFGKMWMAKRCPDHGDFEVMIESGADFYQMLAGRKSPNRFGDMYYLTITNRCNMRCKYCFYKFDSEEDPSMAALVNVCLDLPDQIKRIFLFAAEPTMREDLFDLIAEVRQIGVSWIGIMTNGIKLADENYLKDLLPAVDCVCMSMHLQDDNPPEVFDAKIKCIENFRKAGKKLSDISYTIDSIEKVSAVITDMHKHLDVLGNSFRVRTAVKDCCSINPGRLHLSDLFMEFARQAKGMGVPFVISPNGDNNIYHVNTLFGGIPLRIISTPDAGTVDLRELLPSGPYSGINDKGVYNLVYSIIMEQAARRRNKIKEAVQ